MIKLLIFIGVLGIITESFAISPSWSSSKVAFGEPRDFFNNCTYAGIICESCSKLVQCVETDPGKFTKITIDECDIKNGITCLKTECTNATNPRCPIVPLPNFVCENSGVFPNPFDCTRYHMCIKAEDTVDGKARDPAELKCPAKYGYDPVSTYCKFPLNDGACPDIPPIPECTKAGKSGGIPGTSIYYICLQIGKNVVPHLYMCPHGSVYIESKCKYPN